MNKVVFRPCKIIRKKKARTFFYEHFKYLYRSNYSNMVILDKLPYMFFPFEEMTEIKYLREL